MVHLRDRKINVVPRGHLLLLENSDIPGIVASVGTVLARNGVNIANMSLGRDERGGHALMVLNLDSAPEASVRAELESLEGIAEAKLISLQLSRVVTQTVLCLRLTGETPVSQWTGVSLCLRVCFAPRPRRFPGRATGGIPDS